MEKKETGTTTIGIVCKDGVVMATEKRATMGTMIAHKTTQKLFKIDEHLALTTAGLVGDAQLLARYLKAEAELYRLKREMPMSVKAAATLTANILSSSRYFPYWVQLLIGGVDHEGAHVYSLDPAGGSIPDKYVSTGSGSPYAYGVLEDHYKDNITVDEGINLAIKALNAAMKRDSASGDGIEIVTITKKGWMTVDEKEIERRKKSLNIK
ncbi:MAG: archaeal proteasome endopeptidase complex subunit beta [Thermoplasmata archaeon]|nr:archaeal proteasome endopeptidase complex subunit beta [Thermoplasmata archaeon]RLF56135.1 MAG: proteasome endopeptidase complex, archaeal, beta subunit [Thermoplasmata archaeon]RLF71476.1 MAG: proteasome endopeptidase complex, archaeal, beta subunit [Thermoplasmata archaeon]RLF72299.1 MAG: proteasome endopeptidase complex, archaeal, beta subunit [Thermoplasmata archaeon]RLF74290.1 MAG: proteasome endopeptidase complex, archaeal, beta subunit [Thermoplasmata archaeon]